MHGQVSGEGQGQYEGRGGSLRRLRDGSQDKQVAKGGGRPGYARSDSEGVEKEAMQRQRASGPSSLTRTLPQ